MFQGSGAQSQEMSEWGGRGVLSENIPSANLTLPSLGMMQLCFLSNLPVASGCGFISHKQSNFVSRREWRPPVRARRSRVHASHGTSRYSRQIIPLPSRNIGLEVVSVDGSAPISADSDAPVLFLHGSLHGAWCWERFIAHCVVKKPNRPFVAVSLRGYTSSPPVPAGTVINVEDHVEDLAALLEALDGPPPVIVAHSIGGYYCQRLIKYLRDNGKSAESLISGLVLLSSTPPGGNGKLVLRTMRRLGLRMSWRITMGFVRNAVSTDVAVCRDLFFSRTADGTDTVLEGDEALKGYMEEFAKAGKSRVNTRGIVPITDSSLAATLDGRVIVIGGAEDVIVDTPALDETADFWQARDRPIVLPRAPHDMMLATGWEAAADAVLDSVDTLLIYAGKVLSKS